MMYTEKFQAPTVEYTAGTTEGEIQIQIRHLQRSVANIVELIGTLYDAVEYPKPVCDNNCTSPGLSGQKTVAQKIQDEADEIDFQVERLRTLGEKIREQLGEERLV